MKLLWFQNRIKFAGILSAFWTVLFFIFIAQPAGALIQASVQELAKKKGWDQWLVQLWDAPMFETSSIVQSGWFWAAFWFSLGSGLVLWASIAVVRTPKHILDSSLERNAISRGQNTPGSESTPPHIVFGAPTSEETPDGDRFYQISIQADREIENCTVHSYFDGIDPDGEGITMRWQSDFGHQASGLSVRTLKAEIRSVVPLISRSRPMPHRVFDGSARVWDSRYLDSGEVHPEWFPANVTKNLRLVVRDKNGGEIASLIYEIRVPGSTESNENFLVLPIRH